MIPFCDPPLEYIAGIGFGYTDTGWILSGPDECCREGSALLEFRARLSSAGLALPGNKNQEQKTGKNHHSNQASISFTLITFFLLLIPLTPFIPLF
jgi:hypothetical protein